MDDALLATRAAAGDLDAFGQLYDRYVDPVYDFAWRTLRNADAAEVAVREAFGRAASEWASRGKLAFGPWLFTIAHQAALARAGVPRADDKTAYEEAFGSFDVPDPARMDPAARMTDPELGALAWDAARDLTARDYALLDLHLRQGLAPRDLAGLLNASERDAGSVISRMKRAASGVFGGYIVARRARNCEALRHLLADFDFPPYADPVRTAVDAHIAGCDACKAELASIGDPLAPFAALATIPAPLELKGDAWRDLAALWPVGGGMTEVTAAASAGDIPGGAGGGFGGIDGGTLAAGEGDGGNRMLLFAVAVLGMVVFAFAVAAGALIASGSGDDGGAVVEATATATIVEGTPTEEPVSTRTAGVTIETSTPEPVTDTPVPTETFTPEPATATPESVDTPEPTAEGTQEPGATPVDGTPAPGTDTPTP